MSKRLGVMNIDSDNDLASLLRAAGVRVQPSEQITSDVREAVEAEWRATCAARQRRQRMTLWSVAASVAVVAVTAWLAQPLYMRSDALVASLSRIEGPVEYRSDSDEKWGPLPAGVTLRGGAELRTGESGRAALRLASGVEMRMDSSTRIAFDDTNHARLRRGGVYVDSGANAADASRDLELDTPAGTVRHLGTQYEARVVGDAVRIGVREGRVSVDLRGADAIGTAGEQLVIEDGRVARSPLAPNAASWAWIGAVTPAFAIEGRSVNEFLAWAGRETGRRITYASPEAAQQARAIVLKGSVSGLTPDEAVAAVLSTTPLATAIEGDQIRVEAAAR